MEKIHLIGWALLICLMTASAATSYFTNKTDAINALEKGVLVEAEECEVTAVEEHIFKGKENESQITATYYQWFTRNGELDMRTASTVLESATQEEVEKKGKIVCDLLWAKIQAEYSEVTEAVIEYHKGGLAGVLDRVYSPVTGIWKEKK